MILKALFCWSNQIIMLKSVFFLIWVKLDWEKLKLFKLSIEPPKGLKACGPGTKFLIGRERPKFIKDNTVETQITDTGNFWLLCISTREWWVLCMPIIGQNNIFQYFNIFFITNGNNTRKIAKRREIPEDRGYGPTKLGKIPAVPGPYRFAC